MADQAFTQGTFYGGSATLSTNTTLIGNIVGIGTAPSLVRKTIDITNAASGYTKFLPCDIVDGGEIMITMQYNTQLNYATLFATGSDTITITFPKRSATCGGSVASSAATWVSGVVLEELTPAWELESQMVITAKFKVTGSPTYTPAAA